MTHHTHDLLAAATAMPPPTFGSSERRRRPIDDDLGPETIVPAQFHRRSNADASLVPEKRLLLAVLEEALSTLRQYAGAKTLHGQRLFRDAQRWFASDEVSWPCSFVSVCHALDIDESSIRSRLAAWVRAGRPARGGRAGTRSVRVLVEAEDLRQSA